MIKKLDIGEEPKQQIQENPEKKLIKRRKTQFYNHEKVELSNKKRSKSTKGQVIHSMGHRRRK